jgi:hypothetical protein
MKFHSSVFLAFFAIFMMSNCYGRAFCYFGAASLSPAGEYIDTALSFYRVSSGLLTWARYRAGLPGQHRVQHDTYMQRNLMTSSLTALV